MCDTPINLKLEKPKHDFKTGGLIYNIPLPCGKCLPCKQRRINEWAFRLKEEEKVSISAHFVTLTYDTEFVPLTSRCNMTLNKKHCQDFLKRLRYYQYEEGKYTHEIKYQANNKEPLKRKPIKYYLAGEYGEERKRPHYHIILFNAFPEQLKKAWTFGNVDIAPEFNIKEIFYTLKYCEKENKKPHWYDDEVITEFSLFSKGLGRSWLTPEIHRWYNATNDRNYCMIDNYKIPLAKYYQKRLFSEEKKAERLGHIKAAVDDKEAKFNEVCIRNKINPYQAKNNLKNQHKNILKSQNKRLDL